MLKLPLFEKKGLVHGFSTIEDRNLGFGFAERDEEVALSRSWFLESVSKTEKLAPDQCVGMVPLARGYEETILVVDQGFGGRGIRERNTGPYCEAMITQTPGLGLFLATADCYAVIIYDPEKRVLGLAHAGRESVVRKIPRKTALRMEAQFGCRIADLLVGFGPGIGPEHYPVLNSATFRRTEWREFALPAREAKVQLDLSGFAKADLMRLGVSPKNIASNPAWETFAGKIGFFSHRRALASRRRGDIPGEPEGRHGCVAAMV